MNWTRRELMVGAFGMIGTALTPGISKPQDAKTNVVEIGGIAFGTTWRALLAPGTETVRLGHDIRQLLGSLNAILSPFHKTSELARLNAADHQIDVSKSLADVLYEGLRIARLTNGAFDPTVGPAVARYGFGPLREYVAATAPISDYRGLELAGLTVTKSGRSCTFDPCGIGKGYALDRLGDLIFDRGVNSFFVEFGGEVLVCGHHPSGRLWRTAIEDPTPGAPNPRHAITMAGGALATSSDRRNAYVVGGRRYSHIIDPQTTAPVNNGVASVSVLAGSAMTADALATAFMAMGVGSGFALAEREAIPALFVLREGVSYRDIATAAFRDYLIT